MIKGLGLNLAAAILLASVAGCGGSGKPSQRLTLTGSSTVAPLLAEIAKRYETQHPDVRIEVQTGGSSRGIHDARSGTADIGMISRALKEAESDLQGHTVALDGIGIIVHGDNPIAELDADAIRAIYRGQMRNWMAVGGNDAPITVVNKAEGRSTLELFLKYFELDSAEIQASVIIGDNEQGIKTVAGNPDAIGYVSVGAAEYAISTGVALKLLPMEGVAASTDNIQAGRFPLARPLNLVTYGPPGPLSMAFIDFATSDQVSDLVTGLYFVPQ